jgi:hypothetical protein
LRINPTVSCDEKIHRGVNPPASFGHISRGVAEFTAQLKRTSHRREQQLGGNFRVRDIQFLPDYGFLQEFGNDGSDFCRSKFKQDATKFRKFVRFGRTMPNSVTPLAPDEILDL